MQTDAQRDELKRFLRARREALAPRDLGVPQHARRRTPGLRREEVAALAGVSVTWYTWLEQGRDIQCSTDLLYRLCRALKLSQSDVDYLFKLAGHAPPIRQHAPACIEPAVQAVCDGYTAGPALAMDPRLDVVAFNGLADAVFHFDGFDGPFARNQLWRGFIDPARRRIYVDWETLMAQGVAFLRNNYATRIGDESFETLIEALRRESPEFALMWAAQHTTPLASTAVHLRSQDLGELNLVSTRFGILSSPDHAAFFLWPTDAHTKDLVSRWIKANA